MEKKKREDTNHDDDDNDSCSSQSSSSSDNTVLLSKSLLQNPKQRKKLLENNKPKETSPSKPAIAHSVKPSAKDQLCLICEANGDVVVCSGPCMSAFHRFCMEKQARDDQLTIEASTTSSAWTCPRCVHQLHACFHCKELGPVSKNESEASTSTSPMKDKESDKKRPVRKCRALSCGKFYHHDCITKLPLARIAGTHAICPLHTCAACEQSGAKKESVRCTRCPVAYHSSCLPAEGVTDLGGNRIICPKHVDDQRAKPSMAPADEATATAPVAQLIAAPAPTETVVPLSAVPPHVITALSSERSRSVSSVEDEDEDTKSDASATSSKKHSKSSKRDKKKKKKKRKKNKRKEKTDEEKHASEKRMKTTHDSNDGATKDDSPRSASERMKAKLVEVLGQSDDESVGSPIVLPARKEKKQPSPTKTMTEPLKNNDFKQSKEAEDAKGPKNNEAKEAKESTEPKDSKESMQIKEPMLTTPVKDDDDSSQCPSDYFSTSQSSAEQLDLYPKKQRSDTDGTSARTLFPEETKEDDDTKPAKNVLGLSLQIPMTASDDVNDGDDEGTSRHDKKPISSRAKKKKKTKKTDKSKDDDDEDDEAKWVQCDECKKWRTVPKHLDLNTMPERWYCRMNTWDPKYANCSVPEQVVAATTKPKKTKATASSTTAKKSKLKLKVKVNKLGSAHDAMPTPTPAPTPVATHASTTSQPQLTAESMQKLLAKKQEKQQNKKRKLKLKEKYKEVKWVQCELAHCGKWRVVPTSIDVSLLPATWYCHLNTWAPELAKCSAPNPPEVEMFLMKSQSHPPPKGMTTAAASSHRPNKKPKVQDPTSETTSTTKPTMAIHADTVVHTSNPSRKAKPDAINKTVLEWAQCEKCNKWRKLPHHIKSSTLPDKWYCSMNHWDPARASCSIPEEVDQEPLDASPLPSSQNWYPMPGQLQSTQHATSVGGFRSKRGKLSYSELLYASTGQLRKTYTAESSTLSFEYEGKMYHRDDQYKRSSMYNCPMTTSKQEQEQQQEDVEIKRPDAVSMDDLLTLLMEKMSVQKMPIDKIVTIVQTQHAGVSLPTVMTALQRLMAQGLVEECEEVMEQPEEENDEHDDDDEMRKRKKKKTEHGEILSKSQFSYRRVPKRPLKAFKFWKHGQTAW